VHPSCQTLGPRNFMPSSAHGFPARVGSAPFGASLPALATHKVAPAIIIEPVDRAAVLCEQCFHLNCRVVCWPDLNGLLHAASEQNQESEKRCFHLNPLQSPAFRPAPIQSARRYAASSCHCNRSGVSQPRPNPAVERTLPGYGQCRSPLR
jgi:hypothetical protein